MARVLIATQPWGVVQDTAGNARSGLPVTITSLGGTAATVYSTATGTGTTASTTDSRGGIAGYLEEGTYLISSGAWTGTRRVEAVSGTTGSAKRSGAPDGIPALGLGESLLLPQWQPDNVLLPNDAWDNLFEMNPVDEAQVLSEGGVLDGDGASYLDATKLRAVLGVGPYTRKSARAVNPYGVLCYPIAGVLPNDEFTVEFSLKPRGADLTALSVGNGALRLTSESSVGSGQEVWVTWDATHITATANVWDAQDIPTGGSNRALTASLTIAAGDFPANVWTRVSLVWNGSTLSLIVGNNTKRTGGTSTATSSAGSTCTPPSTSRTRRRGGSWWRRPITGRAI